MRYKAIFCDLSTVFNKIRKILHFVLLVGQIKELLYLASDWATRLKLKLILLLGMCPIR